MKFRSLLYRVASLLGDANAVQKNKIGQRIVRKAVQRTTGKIINKTFRRLFK
jgi:hypothetical protein